MPIKNIDLQNCSVAHALELIGEGWTILILREAFFGSRRFEAFQKHLGIARNILTIRLNKLCEHGIMQRTPIKEGAKRHEYRLTPMGRDLYPTLIALTQWGDRWLHTVETVPVRFVERATGDDIANVVIQSRDGRELDARDLAVCPGPGATEETKERIRQLNDAREDKIKEQTV